MAKLPPKSKIPNSGFQDFNETPGRKLTRYDLPSQTFKISSKPQVINEKALWEKAIEIELASPRHKPT